MKLNTLVLIGIVAVGLMATSASADVIAGVVGTGSSSWGGYSLGPYTVVNGTGMSGDGADAGKGWFSNGWEAGSAYYVIDLKNIYSLDTANTLRVWNYNQSGAIQRGIKTAAFYTSLDGISWTQVAGATLSGTTVAGQFDQATGLAGYVSNDYVNFNTSVTARYVKIRSLSSYDSDQGSVGLSEVRVAGTLLSNPQSALGSAITVSSVAASVSPSGGFSANNLIDGSGLTGLTHSNFTWPGNNTCYFEMTSATLSLDFNLGSSKSLGAMRVWNLSEGSGGVDRGMRTIDIYVSADSTFTTDERVYDNLELLMGPCGGATVNNAPQIIALQGWTGQYVRITSVGNTYPSWGGDQVGLQEVQFFAPATSPNPTLNITTALDLRVLAGGAVNITGNVDNTPGTGAYNVTGTVTQGAGGLTVGSVLPSPMGSVTAGGSTNFTAVVSTGLNLGTQAYNLSVTDGTLTKTATRNLIVGQGVAAGTSFDPTKELIADVVAGNTLAGLTSTVDANNAATLLAGTVSTDAQQIGMNWRQHTETEHNANLIVSDVLDLTLDVSELTGGKYVLEMSYNDQDEWIKDNELNLALAGGIYIAYKNGSNWVNAGTNLVLGTENAGMTKSWSELGSSTTVGDWGVDIGANQVWVVLDHASEFAVVPEPATLAFLALGGLSMLGATLRRRRSA